MSASTGLFGTALRTKTLLAIALLEETHASELSRILERSLSRVQAAVLSLELAGIIVGLEVGKARRLRLNPRYPAQAELRALLERLGELDQGLQKRLATERRRPGARRKRADQSNNDAA